MEGREGGAGDPYGGVPYRGSGESAAPERVWDVVVGMNVSATFPQVARDTLIVIPGDGAAVSKGRTSPRCRVLVL